MDMQQIMSWPTCCARNVRDYVQSLGLRGHSGPCGEMQYVYSRSHEWMWFCPRCQVCYPGDRTDGLLGDKPCPDCGKMRSIPVAGSSIVH